MPTAYYNITNNYVIELVNNNDFTKLNEYLNDKFDASKLKPISSTPFQCSFFVGSSNDFNDKIYDILSYAVDCGNIKVIDYYAKYINDERFDGNTYTLLHLAIDNYMNKQNNDNLMVLNIIINNYINNHIKLHIFTKEFYIKLLETKHEIIDKINKHF